MRLQEVVCGRPGSHRIERNRRRVGRGSGIPDQIEAVHQERRARYLRGRDRRQILVEVVRNDVACKVAPPAPILVGSLPQVVENSSVVNRVLHLQQRHDAAIVIDVVMRDSDQVYRIEPQSGDVGMNPVARRSFPAVDQHRLDLIGRDGLGGVARHNQRSVAFAFDIDEMELEQTTPWLLLHLDRQYADIGADRFHLPCETPVGFGPANPERSVRYILVTE